VRSTRPLPERIPFFDLIVCSEVESMTKEIRK
jgi:hypothetical protein